MTTVHHMNNRPPETGPTIPDYELREWKAERAARDERRCEALKLYEPLPFQDEYHKCTAKECIIQKANQVGGSLTGFAEVARAVTGQDPYDKYPKRDGVAVCLGFGEKHVGRVIHKYLFRAGAFDIIRDETTGLWRTYRPWAKDVKVMGNLGDKHRKREKKPAPPLIPSRFIDGKIAWVKARENIFSYVKFKTGWELYALNSAGEAGQAQGFQADLYHIDEDLATDGWYIEALGRTVTRAGLIRWTALPHARTDDILDMIQRAEEYEIQEDPNPITVRIKATLFDNPYVSDESKKETITLFKQQGEENFRRRVYGEISFDSIRMYPTFDRRLHDVVRFEEPRTKLQAAITTNDGKPPDNWCRYMICDPGHTVFAVAFFAVPPPAEFGEYKILYKELYLRNCDKEMFGQNVKRAVGSDTFQDFIIDAHGGRLRELASGALPKRQYEEVMEKLGIVCEARGSRFIHGSDDVKGREEKLREWLALRRDGTAIFGMVAAQCPETCREMERFKKKTIKYGSERVPIDEGNRRVNTHIVECLEYAAAHGLPYIKPARKAKKASFAHWLIKQRQDRAAQRAARHGGMQTHITLGPQGVPH